MNKPIVGEVVRQRREALGWTLKELANQCQTVAGCKVTIDSLSRIERGKQTGSRPSTRGALAKALGVEPGVLTGEKTLPPESSGQSAPQADTGEYQILSRVDGAVRNAFSLVVLRYGIPRPRIIELAPLLFVLAAERCLGWQRAKLKAVEEALDQVETAAAGLHHLPKTIAPSFEATEPLQAAKRSVAQLDLLAERLSDDLYSIWGPQKDDYDVDQDNPFVSSLRREATNPDIATITAFSRRAVDFQVCRADALKLADGDERLAAGILDGWAPLHEIPELIREEATEERLAWLRERAAEFEARRAVASPFGLEELGL
jgi:transcriptional regulator with XRE-family HTH domain